MPAASSRGRALRPSDPLFPLIPLISDGKIRPISMRPSSPPSRSPVTHSQTSPISHRNPKAGAPSSPPVLVSSSTLPDPDACDLLHHLLPTTVNLRAALTMASELLGHGTPPLRALAPWPASIFPAVFIKLLFSLIRTRQRLELDGNGPSSAACFDGILWSRLDSAILDHDERRSSPFRSDLRWQSLTLGLLANLLRRLAPTTARDGLQLLPPRYPSASPPRISFTAVIVLLLPPIVDAAEPLIIASTPFSSSVLVLLLADMLS